MTIEKPKGLVGRQLLSGSVLRLGNLIVAAIAALLLMPLMVHHLGDRLYGFWSLAGAFIGYYGLIDLGLSSAVSQYLCIALGKKDIVECRAVFNTALAIQSILGCVALAATAAIAVSSRWFCQNPADASLFWKVIVILGVNAALGFPVRVYAGLLEAELRFDIQSGLDFLGQTLRTGMIVVALLAGGGLLAVAWMSLLASLPVIFLQVGFARHEAPWARFGDLSLDRKRTKSFLSYSIYTFVATIADTLRFQIDPLVIASFVGLAAVTHYRVASVLMRYYISAVISFTGTFQQVMSRSHGAGDRDRLERVFYFATKLSLCMSVFIGFLLIVWGKPFIVRWMGANYADAYLPMVVLTVAVLLDIGQSPSINLLYATFNHRFYTYMNLAEGVINLICSLVLVRFFGILGVALGTLIGALAIRIAIQPWWVCKAVGLRYGEYMRFIGWNLLCCGCLVCAVTSISAWGLRPDYNYLVVSAVCATVLYGTASWFIVFNGRERVQLLAAITNRSQQPSDDEAVVATQ